MRSVKQGVKRNQVEEYTRSKNSRFCSIRILNYNNTNKTRFDWEIQEVFTEHSINDACTAGSTDLKF